MAACMSDPPYFPCFSSVSSFAASHDHMHRMNDGEIPRPLGLEDLPPLSHHVDSVLVFEYEGPSELIEKRKRAKQAEALKAFLEVGAVVSTLVNLQPRLCKELNMDESQLCYSGTRVPDSVLLGTARSPNIDVFKIWERIPLAALCAGERDVYAVAICRADFTKCEEKKSDQISVNSVEGIKLLFGNAQVFFTDTALRAGRQAVSQDWYIDSGATDHFCDSRAIFQTYSPGSGGIRVTVANGTQAEVAGIGTVRLRLTSGESVTLKNVLHVPTITMWLISVRKLTEDGFRLNFEGQKFEIYKDGRVIGDGDGCNELGMYRLNINNNPTGASTSENDNNPTGASDSNPTGAGSSENVYEAR